MSIEITRLYALILIPLVFAFVYYTTKKFGSFSKRDRVVIISRVMIFILLILAFADITINIKGKNIATVFLFDVSDSVGDFKKEGIKFIDKSLKNIPKNNRAGVVVFGDDSQVDKIINRSEEYKSIKSTPITTATNIQEAIEGSISLFPKGSAKRIVLITDGEENQGDILKTIPLITEQQIDLKVYKVVNSQGNEVYVDNVKVPDNISIGEEFSVVTTIESNIQTKAKITLFSGREVKGEENVELQKGKNTFVFKDVQNTGGFKGYRVLVEAEDDSNMGNNEYSCFTNVISKPKILLIEGNSGDGAGITEVLKTTNSDFKTISPKSAPQNLNEMLEFKTIILSNVYADDLNKRFMDNVETYVKDYGGGLITFGGKDAYALGEYKDTPLEKVLPVNMDKKGKNEIPKISLTLIIDHSGSMSGAPGETSKLTLAKEAASNAVDNLRSTDEIGLIAFDDKFEWVVPKQQVKEKIDIKESIAGIDNGGGTSIYPALKAGVESQIKSDAKIKHVILLTDGQDGFGIENYSDIIEKLEKNNITLSTVSVGQDSNGMLLNYLADRGKGRSYHTDLYTDIPRIFAKEVLLSAGTYIQNEEFIPKLLSNHEIMNGVLSDSSLPTLLGYIGTSRKDKAIEILTSSHDEPILAAWQYGIGRSVSWTSDINGEWSKNYLTWNKGAQLFKNMIYWTIPEYNDSGKLSITQNGNKAVVEFYNDKLQDNTKVTGIYNGESGKNGEFNLSQVEPGKFKGTVPLNDLGFYTFNVREELDGRVNNSYTGAFSLQYSEEFKFNKNKAKLDTIVEEVGGSFITKAEEVFQGSIKESYKRWNVTITALVLAIILFLLDIAYRRLNLDISKYAGKLKENIDIQIQKHKEKGVVNEIKEERVIKSNKPKKAKIIVEKKKSIQKIDTNVLLNKKKDRER